MEAVAFVLHLSHSVTMSTILSSGILTIISMVETLKPSHVSSRVGGAALMGCPI